MPIVKTLADAYQKYTAKTAPDRVGARYDVAKTIALPRYIENVNIFVVVRETIRDVLADAGVPPAKQGAYYAFGAELAKKALSHTGAALKKVADGLKAKYVALGLDPAILDKIVKIVGVS